MAVTLQQIAEAAGVSRGTVDRALNMVLSCFDLVEFIKDIII